MNACMGGYLDLVQYLVDQGADVTAKSNVSHETTVYTTDTEFKEQLML